MRIAHKDVTRGMPKLVSRSVIRCAAVYAGAEGSTVGGAPSTTTSPRVGPAQRGLPRKWPIPGVKHVILVASAKGGVGKSTTAVNLALGLAANEKNARVGILDADIFGPSLPTLMNLSGLPRLNAQNQMLPLVNFGIKCMSMGFLMAADQPAVWRGLMVMSAVEKLLRQVAWGTLDYLVVDMPPGTVHSFTRLFCMDSQFAAMIVPHIVVAGVVIVSSPQEIALVDARRGVKMFHAVDVKILGLVQNMSMFVCPNCKHESAIFGHGGAALFAAKEGVPLLADIPLDPTVGVMSDEGRPVTVAAPDHPVAQLYRGLATNVVARLGAPLV